MDGQRQQMGREGGTDPTDLRSVLNGYFLDSVRGLEDGWRQFYTADRQKTMTMMKL